MRMWSLAMRTGSLAMGTGVHGHTTHDPPHLLHDEEGIPFLMDDRLLHTHGHRTGLIILAQVLLAQHHTVGQGRAAREREGVSAPTDILPPWHRSPPALQHPPDAVGGRQHPLGGNQGPATSVVPGPRAAVLQRDLRGQRHRVRAGMPPSLSPSLSPCPSLCPLTCHGQLWAMASSPPTTREPSCGGTAGWPHP